MREPKKYSRGEPMPVRATGSAKLMHKIDKLHNMSFSRAYDALLDHELKIARKK